MKEKHDGDCWIYAANGVCTCGLLHGIVRHPDSDKYAKHTEEIIKHEIGLHYLNRLKDGIPNISEEEARKAEQMLREMGFDV